jgi:hypothetical protein
VKYYRRTTKRHILHSNHSGNFTFKIKPVLNQSILEIPSKETKAAGIATGYGLEDRGVGVPVPI